MHETERGSVSRPALSRLISESPGEFAAARWGRAPLLSRAGELVGGLDELFSLDAADELVANRAIRTPFVRMAAEGSVLPTTRFTSSGGYGAEIGDQLDSAKVLAEFAAGSTLVLQGLHKTWEPIARFARQLSTDVGAACQVNAYITPAASRGFDPHYDVHDVFVIQIHGSKAWTIHEPVHPDPLKNQPWSEHRKAVGFRAEGVPYLSETFVPGDVLYLPRGWIHSAVAQGGTSIHLTIGVEPVTRYSIVERALAVAASIPSLRASLPIDVDSEPDSDRDDRESSARVADTLRELAAAIDSSSFVAEVAKSLHTSFGRSLAAEPVRPLATVDALDRLADDTLVEWRRGLDARILVADTTVTIALPARSISLPREALDALTALMHGEPIAAGFLPGLDPSSSLVVSRRLVREAVLRIIS